MAQMNACIEPLFSNAPLVANNKMLISKISYQNKFIFARPFTL